jgi:hypothetical protein
MYWTSIHATKHAVIVGGNTAGRDQQQLLAEFQYASQQRPDIQKPVWHASLSLPQAERLDDATWRQVTDRFMQQMGFYPTIPLWWFGTKTLISITCTSLPVASACWARSG